MEETTLADLNFFCCRLFKKIFLKFQKMCAVYITWSVLDIVFDFVSDVC